MRMARAAATIVHPRRLPNIAPTGELTLLPCGFDSVIVSAAGLDVASQEGGAKNSVCPVRFSIHVCACVVY